MTKISGRQNKRMEELTEEEKKALRGSKFAPLPAASGTAAAASNAVDGYDVFSAGNVELVDTHRRRGRPRKKTKSPSDLLKVSSPTRIHVEMPNGPSSLVNDIVSSVAMVVPSMDAVVKVFCVHTEPNFSLHWQRKRQYSLSSSGFVIKGRRVLTNAYSVEHYTQVKLKKRASDTKYVATVLAIGTECDIAMLIVEDDEFWQGVSPVEFGNLPALQDAVTVVGYPIECDTISVTSGVGSRIEILSYVHGSTELLGLQIDATINSGNSSGPAFNDKGDCVGIAFQSLKPIVLSFVPFKWAMSIMNRCSDIGAVTLICADKCTC